MKKFHKLLSSLLACAMLMSFAPAALAADTGKTLTIGTPYTLDTLVPWQFTSDGDRYVISNIYECLVEYDTGKFIPVLAESVTALDDTTWEVKLRENAYWQTGNGLFGDEKVPVTAEDVKFCFDFTLDPTKMSKQHASVSNVIQGCEIVDERTLRFTTYEPSAMFQYQLSRVMIFPKKAVETGYDLSVSPVGSGAYKFLKYDMDDQVVLVKNPDYPIEPALDTVIFKIIPDKVVAAIALQNKEIDIDLQVLSTDVAAVGSDPDLTLVPNTMGWYRYAGFNCSDPLFADVNNRKAVTMAVDMDKAVDALFVNSVGAQLAVRAYGPIPLELAGANQDAWKAAGTAYDPDGAVKLLEANGWKKGSDGIYAKDGQRFSFVIKTPANDNNRMKLGTIIAASLKRIGVEAVAQPVEWATFLNDIKTGATQMFIMGGGSTMNGMEMLFHSKLSKGSSHQLFYANDELDALIEKAAVTIDPAARAEVLTEASCIAVRDCLHLFGYFEYSQIGMNNRVTDFAKDPTCWFGLCNGYRNVGVK